MSTEQQPSLSEEQTAPKPSVEPTAPTPLNWPEDMAVCEEAKAAFADLSKTCNLSPEVAQKLVDLEANFARQTAAQQAKQQQAQLAQWAKETKQFFGPAWEKEISLAVRAADAFGGPELRALLEETGLGNHPVIVRTFNGIGKRISEDNTPGGKPSAVTDKTFTEALYGNEQ